MVTIEQSLISVRQRIQRACAQAGRSDAAVTLLAVSKTFPADAVRQAAAAGQSAFGENYVQEGVSKILALRDLPLQWHCIGPIQSNKSALVAEHFDWAHTIDRLKIAQRLGQQRPAGKAPLQVCIQVNVDGGANKSGVPSEHALALARAVADVPGLRLRGLMAIPEPAPDAQAALALCQRVAAVFEHIAQAGLPASAQWDTLSLGMSADLEAAIAAGSTLVRVGSAVFGQR